MKQYLRQLPPVHELQKDRRFEDFLNSFQLTADQGTKFIQQELSKLRESLLNGESAVSPSEENFIGLIFSNAEKKAGEWNEDRLMRVINGTGTVLHTNLGRSRLSSRAVEHVARAACDYSNLEYRIAEGKRGSRHDILEDLIKQATGAEAAMVVNNNAAAVFLILSAMAKNKEVIVSRGQLVEIGGSFRVSSIMEESGAYLHEVGTTNKTHLFDYENAVNEETAMIMKVHTSNFVMSGFTATVETEELAELKKRHEGLVFYEDLGSGALFDFKKHGIGNEPHVRDVIAAGVDIVSFSGDKLLGGPQAGIIAGNKDLIDKLKKHQLARVLRVDKMTFAALEETLKAYVAGGNAVMEIPTVRDIMRSSSDIKQQAENFISALESRTGDYRLELLDGFSQIGGGTMPEVQIPTHLTAISHKSLPAQELAARLRESRPPVIARIQDDKVCIDFRTVREEEVEEVMQSLVDINAMI
ncbi:L-seryl-tRNA(Sec) selenium transferase [Planococcus halotolerans]|uniref:L-seryl-tRNA(Sec) selenium transferase n=1 Tax=Planococcus halotolerans TaxID=2233542 RepID=A0A365L6N0_9BACL|nr:L-seryl-tRNA(Sec) selenium transferase [Planococcus halotolerans]QHJ70195.1 L-seryl-tRNA(Sec) selenium transferase [Planococcus halotolerans]RAZ81074.1 L-seryl-tRNA(Sec) selenium transferase [Planococcus halotolerans]